MTHSSSLMLVRKKISNERNSQPDMNHGTVNILSLAQDMASYVTGTDSKALQADRIDRYSWRRHNMQCLVASYQGPFPPHPAESKRRRQSINNTIRSSLPKKREKRKKPPVQMFIITAFSLSLICHLSEFQREPIATSSSRILSLT